MDGLFRIVIRVTADATIGIMREGQDVASVVTPMSGCTARFRVIRITADATMGIMREGLDVAPDVLHSSYSSQAAISSSRFFFSTRAPTQIASS